MKGALIFLAGVVSGIVAAGWLLNDDLQELELRRASGWIALNERVGERVRQAGPA